MARLAYETIVSDSIPRAGAPLPTGETLVWSPITSTLIFGAEDAALVDPPLTDAQARAVADRIDASGRHLRLIYVTHGHGDHWFGADVLARRFPGATICAMPGTIALMHRQATEGRERIFDRGFPGQIGDTTVRAEAITGRGLSLEGNALVPVEVGHSDTDDTTVLHVPSIDLVVAGDVVYNGVHQYLLEGGRGGLDAWLTALDAVEALHPQAIVAGHKNKALPDDPRTIAETRRYLRDAKRVLDERPTPQQYFERMLADHGERLNRGPLWYSGVGLLDAR